MSVGMWLIWKEGKKWQELYHEALMTISFSLPLSLSIIATLSLLFSRKHFTASLWWVGNVMS